MQPTASQPFNSPQSNPLTAHPLQLWLVFLLVGIWMGARPYLGISLDATYYAGEALHALPDQLLANDLFFHRWSQGQFTVFTAAYGHLIQWLGVDQAAWLTALLGRLTWLLCAGLGAVWITRQHGLRFELGLAALLLAPPFYEGTHALAVAEPFATPRPFAEAWLILSVCAMATQRHRAAAITAVMGALFHPLMALPVLILWACHVMGRRWLVALPLMAGVAAIAASLLWGTDRLLLTFDDDWWAVVKQRCPMVLFSAWEQPALARAVLVPLWLGIAGQLLAKEKQAMALLCRQLALVTGLLLILWVIGCQTRHVLLVQLQPWRVLWIAQLWLPVAWAFVTVFNTSLPSHFKRLSWALLLACYCVDSAVVCTAAALVGLSLLGYKPLALEKHISPKLIGFTADLVIFICIGLSAFDLSFYLNHSSGGYLSNQLSLIFSTVGLMVPLVVFLLRFSPVPAAPWWLQLPVLVFMSAATWFAWWAPGPNRDISEKYEKVRAALPQNALVASDLGLAAVWVGLQRANYGTRTQGAGALFQRDSALLLRERLSRLEKHGFEESNSQLHVDSEPPFSVTQSSIQALCKEDSQLTHVVLEHTVPGATDVIHTGASSIFIFDCKAMLANI